MKTKGKHMARTKANRTATDLDDVDVNPDELEEVEVTDDVDAWMREMLAGPSESDWDF